MKKHRIDVAHRAVPRGYDPGYPSKLDPAEYRDAVAHRTGARIRNVLAALGAAAAGGAALSQDAGKTREDRVLEVLREGAFGGSSPISWFAHSKFRASPAPGGLKHRLFVPRIPISFGNSYSGVIDAGEVRALARRLFDAYGLSLESDVVLTPAGGRVVLDGCNRASKLGFKIRGGTLAAGGMGPRPTEEGEATGLSDAELGALVADGYRLHVADWNSYPVMDHDRSPSMFAYLASMIDFLNGATDGPDIDVTAVTAGWHERIGTPDDDVVLPDGGSLERADGEWKVNLEKPGTIVVRFRHRPAPGSPAIADSYSKWRVLDRAVSTAGSPTIVEVPFKFDSATYRQKKLSYPANLSCKFRLVQEREAGQKPIDLVSAAPLILAPSTFDAAKPFRIEIEASPARYLLGTGVKVAVMPR